VIPNLAMVISSQLCIFFQYILAKSFSNIIVLIVKILIFFYTSVTKLNDIIKYLIFGNTQKNVREKLKYVYNYEEYGYLGCKAV
jgi:hypothetical protein